MPTATLQPNPCTTGEGVTWAAWIASCHLDCDLVGKTGAPNMFDQGHTRGWYTNPNFSFSKTFALPGRTYSGFSNGTASTAGAGIWEQTRVYSSWNGITSPWVPTWQGVGLAALPFTVEAWIYITAYNIGSNTYYLMGPDDPSSIRNCALYIDTTGHLAFRFYGVNLITYIATNATTTVPLNQWNHVCAMRSGDVIYLFLNGTVIASTNLPTGLVHSDTSTFECFECRNNRTGFFFTGYWDQAMFSYYARYPIGGFTPDSSRVNLLVNSPIGTNLSLPPVNNPQPISGLSWTTNYQGNFTINNINVSIATFSNVNSQICSVVAGNGIQREAIKHYFEVLVLGTPNSAGTGVGIVDDTNSSNTSWVGSDTHGIGFYYPTFQIYTSGGVASSNLPTGFGTSGDILCVAVYWDSSTSTLKFWVRRNGGAWQGGGDPATNTTPTYTNNTITTGKFKVAACSDAPFTPNGYSFQVFQNPNYTIPTGFAYWDNVSFTVIGSPPRPAVGIPYSYTYSQINNTGAVTWSYTGTLPPGLSLSSSGVLSGTPTASGAYTFTIYATDSASHVASRVESQTVTTLYTKWDTTFVGPHMSVTSDKVVTCTDTTGVWGSTRSTTSLNSGKRLFEVRATNAGTVGGDWMVGMCDSTQTTTTYLTGSSTPGIGNQANYTGQYIRVITFTSSYLAGSSGTTAISSNGYSQWAVDFGAGKGWISNGPGDGWIGGGSPDSGSVPTFTFTAGSTLFIGSSLFSSNTTMSATLNTSGLFALSPGNVTTFAPWDV